MAAAAPDDDRWRAFYREQCADAVSALAAAYPGERSLYVDVLDLYDFDQELAGDLFSNPDEVLDRARATLRGLHEPFGRVNVRLVNHPGLLAIGALRTRHVGELVTVEGTASEVDGVQAGLATAVYACGACGGATPVRPEGSRHEPPLRCAECGDPGALVLRPGRSEYVDRQRVVIEGEGPDGAVRRLDVSLDDDLVEAIRPGETVVVTGVLRLEPTDHASRYAFHLDGLSVEAAREGDDNRDADDAIQALIESRWQFVVDR